MDVPSKKSVSSVPSVANYCYLCPQKPHRNLSSDYAFNAVNLNPGDNHSNVVSLDDWTKVLEPAGAVFLPQAGIRLLDGTHLDWIGYNSSTVASHTNWCIGGKDSYINWNLEEGGHFGDAWAVRLVRNVE